MQVTELKKDGLDFYLKVTIPSIAITQEIDKELSDLAKKAKIAGFRAGKVPTSIIRQKYAASVRQDIIRQQINKSINEIISKDKLKIATEPNIDNLVTDEGSDLEFTVKFELMPEITIPNFKEISIEKPILNIAAQDIDKHLNELAQSTKSYEQETKDPAKAGDQVTLDAVGYVDGKAFDGGRLENYKLVLGSNTFINGFEDQLIDKKVGDLVTVQVTFPENYHSAQLAGKPSEFNVEIIAVHTVSASEINDDFAKKFDCDTVEKLRDKITNDLESSATEQIHTILKMRLFNKLENILDFTVPSSLMNREYQFLKTRSTDDIIDEESKTTSDTELEEYYQKLSLRRVRIGLLLAEYAQIKDLKITQDDIRNAVLQQMRQFPNQAKEVMEYYQKNRQAIESLRGPILEDKAVQSILEKELSITTKEYSIKELEKLLNEENDI